MALSFPFRYSI